jgi:hypothetical protein
MTLFPIKRNRTLSEIPRHSLRKVDMETVQSAGKQCDRAEEDLHIEPREGAGTRPEGVGIDAHPLQH